MRVPMQSQYGTFKFGLVEKMDKEQVKIERNWRGKGKYMHRKTRRK
jgi:hypothetical protein